MRISIVNIIDMPSNASKKERMLYSNNNAVSDLKIDEI
jgi:hypothetical protein